MDPWTLGLGAALALGLAAVVFGALHDRRRNARAAREMLSPPQRPIPHFAPDAPAPRYLSELQARRPPTEPPQLTPAERHNLATALQQPTTTTIPVGYASSDFITDPSNSWAVQSWPRVAVCVDPVTSIRELLPILEKVTLTRTPLVIAVPEVAPEVLATLEVNHIQGLLRLLVVVAPNRRDIDTIASATQATALSRSDLRSGFVEPQHLGATGIWVSDRHNSHLVAKDWSATSSAAIRTDLAGSG